MSISHTETDGVISIVMEGQLTGMSDSIGEFNSLSNMTADKPQKMTVDMSKVTFIDSLCIGLLLGLYLKCEEQNVPFEFISVSEHVADVFETTNLDGIFPAIPEPQ